MEIDIPGELPRELKVADVKHVTIKTDERMGMERD